MAEKKKQHLVPTCYLKNFVAEVPEDAKLNPNFESGVFVNNNFLSDEWKMRSVNHGIFTKSYVYTLTDEDPKKPAVENYLSTVEGDFTKYAKEIFDGSVTNENLSFISYFTTLQVIRVERFLEMFQGAWDQLAKLADAFDGGVSYENAVRDLAKKQILTTDIGASFHSHAHIIYNQTSFPFVTSDTPVLNRQLNIKDMSTLFPKEHMVESIRESQEFPILFFPLNPHVAYASCELFRDDIDGSSGNCVLTGHK